MAVQIVDHDCVLKSRLPTPNWYVGDLDTGIYFRKPYGVVNIIINID